MKRLLTVAILIQGVFVGAVRGMENEQRQQIILDSKQIGLASVKVRDDQLQKDRFSENCVIFGVDLAWNKNNQQKEQRNTSTFNLPIDVIENLLKKEQGSYEMAVAVNSPIVRDNRYSQEYTEVVPFVVNIPHNKLEEAIELLKSQKDEGVIEKTISVPSIQPHGVKVLNSKISKVRDNKNCVDIPLELIWDESCKDNQKYPNKGCFRLEVTDQTRKLLEETKDTYNVEGCMSWNVVSSIVSGEFDWKSLQTPNYSLPLTREQLEEALKTAENVEVLKSNEYENGNNINTINPKNVSVICFSKNTKNETIAILLFPLGRLRYVAMTIDGTKDHESLCTLYGTCPEIENTKIKITSVFKGNNKLEKSVSEFDDSDYQEGFNSDRLTVFYQKNVVFDNICDEKAKVSIQVYDLLHVIDSIKPKTSANVLDVYTAQDEYFMHVSYEFNSANSEAVISISKEVYEAYKKGTIDENKTGQEIVNSSFWKNFLFRGAFATAVVLGVVAYYKFFRKK